MDIFDKLDYYEKKQLIYLHWKLSANPACRKQIINSQLFDKLIPVYFVIIAGSYLALPEIKSKIWYRIRLTPAIKDITLYLPIQTVTLERLYNLLHEVIKN